MGAEFNFAGGEAPKPGYIKLVTPDGELNLSRGWGAERRPVSRPAGPAWESVQTRIAFFTCGASRRNRTEKYLPEARRHGMYTVHIYSPRQPGGAA
jgi:hypothetical protein